MKKMLISVLLTTNIISTNISSKENLQYNDCHTISEVICLESEQINCFLGSNPLILSELYANRGESLLLNNQIDEALNDFILSYKNATQVENDYIIPHLLFRALFGQALAYAYLSMVEEVESVSEMLLNIIQTVQCEDCYQNNKIVNSSHRRISDTKSFLFFSNHDNVPIYGPDSISIQDCIDLIENTRGYAKLLISRAPLQARGILNYTIDQLANAGRSCCRAGGIWKACFQPIANKYHQWNQKWKLLGIPPDPAWD